MSRIETTFRQLISRREGALIGYLMAGDPSPSRSLEYARALIRGGADILELGVPFSDPVADGPIIQAAGVRALSAGTTPAVVFELAKTLRRETRIPLVLMTYYNPVFALGEGGFLKRCMEAGVDGVIVPDLPVEEAEPFIAQARKFRVDTVFLATPETDGERLKRIAAETKGFLYVVSRYGVTGAPTELDAHFRGLIERFRGLAPEGLPLAVGFGISRAEQIRRVLQAGAQGVIVGSAFVRRVAEGISPEALEGFARQLKGGTRPSSPPPSQREEGRWPTKP